MNETLIAIFVIYQIFGSCFAFASILYAFIDLDTDGKSFGLQKRSDKPEHPARTLLRYIGNGLIILFGTLLPHITLTYFTWCWWQDRMKHYREAKGLYEKIERTQAEIDAFELEFDYQHSPLYDELFRAELDKISKRDGIYYD